MDPALLMMQTRSILYPFSDGRMRLCKLGRCRGMVSAVQVNSQAQLERSLKSWCWIEDMRDPAMWWDKRCKMESPVSSSTCSSILKQGFGEQNTAFELVATLKECSKMGDLEGGKKLHRTAVATGLHTQRYVAAALITMYGKCRSMSLAQEVFDGLIQRDVVAWTSLIQGYVQNGKCLVAMDLFNSMDCEPNSVSFVAVLKACAGLACDKASEKEFCLQKGIAIHKHVREYGFDSNIFVTSTLVDMYSKCGSMDRARQVFDGMIGKNVVVWNSLILGYVQNGQNSAAMDLFSSMDCQPDHYTFAAALKACAALAGEENAHKSFCLEKGSTTHKQVKERGLDSDMIVASTLVDMYSKCGSMNCAREVFDSMVFRDVVTWSSLIMGYVQNRKYLEAMDLFASMNCEPNSFTYVAVLKACASLAGEHESEMQYCLEKGIAVHKQLKSRRLDSDIIVASALVDMYSKCGSMEQAKQVFDGMTSKNVVTWTSLIIGYVQAGNNQVAMDLFSSMNCTADSFAYVAALKACMGLASERVSEKDFWLRKGMVIHKQVEDCGLGSNLFVASTLLDMYSKCGSIDYARQVFDKMSFKDVFTWTSLIMGYVHYGEDQVALDLFFSMDCEPNSLTYVAALKACGSLAALPAGQQIHARACKLGLDQDEVVATTLMDLYGNCGSMSRAEELFNNMKSPDTASWNALITGYSSLGEAFDHVFGLVKKMQKAGIRLNGTTFICILTACSHAGLVEDGKRYFDLMRRCDVSPTVEHYNCMVDMLGRANKLREALAFVNSMPFKANAVTWMTLLGACRNWKNIEVGKVAFDALVGLGGTEGGAYVLMSDLYGLQENLQQEQRDNEGK